MPIRRLPPLLVNQIAAGEVIERPASVVKELIENSLDAGATQIDVAVEDGGRQLIRVRDDGAGIPAAELTLALAPHATSKLETPEQLASIVTLGFRGEALASIASVSRLRLTSQVRNTSGGGAQIEASGATVGPVTPAACAPGTAVEVRDLFFNTPARRNFLRTAGAEFGHIDEAVRRCAMVRPQVSFRLTHNGKLVLDLPGADRRRRCLDLLGAELEPALLEFDAQWDLAGAADSPGPWRVWGLAGLPAIARATARGLHLCVNGRPIHDRNLAHAAREAYRGLIPPDRQPVAVVCIDMPADAVDVNVHPAKAEVRFRDPSRVYGLVLAALRQRLLGADLTPAVGLHLGAASFTAPALPDTAGALSEVQPAPTSSSPPRPNLEPTSELSGVPRLPGVSAFVEYFRKMDPTQKGFAYQQVRDALSTENPELVAPAPTSGCPPDTNPALTPDGRLAPVLRAQGVLQVHQSYLVTQDQDGILIVDQHALHERVMFEDLRRRVLDKPLESQRLLMPAVVPAGAKRQALAQQLQTLLTPLGIELAPLGPDALAVHAFPSFLFDRKVDPVEFISDLLDRAEEGQFDHALDDATGSKSSGKSSGAGLTKEAVLHEVLDMMACKAAVKAGEQMSPQELAALLARREEIERSSNCPHGRPTTIRLTLRELEKQFKRT